VKSIFFYSLILPCFCSLPAWANDCQRFRGAPLVRVREPDFSVSVESPKEEMNLLHGKVIATFSEEYEIDYNAEWDGDGWCLYIDRITAVVGYTGFVIQIDRRHKFDSCEWHATKAHEDEHIRAHLSAVSENKDEIKQSVREAAAAILPLFVENESDLEIKMNEMQDELAGQPQIKILMQKLDAEQEIRNKKVDLGDKGWRINECQANE